VAGVAAAQQRPNIVVIMGDDIGIWNIGAYHRGMMAGRTPNLDQIAAEGMLFTDYYAEASCTAGRANFITGELPIRTGMTTVGQAGAPTGLPAQAVTIATALKDMGYATGQFGKNHLGDKNEFLPTVHGFDEFFGYLYHLDAMEDPCHPNYLQDLRAQVGPRNMLHAFATTVDDPTVDPRWGKVGKQKIEDKGELCPKRMETVDDESRDLALTFIDKAKADNKPFFLWLNPTRMHIVTHLSPKYQAMRNSTNGWSIQEAGMAQHLTNLRLDPFERTGWPESGTKVGSQQYFDWFKYEFWRFVFVQQQVETLAMTAIEFPPMQRGASFNLDVVKAKIEAARAAMGN
jgi:arylsulfatase A-like enzyme